MQQSKLPKLAGLKPPQVHMVRPLGTLSENKVLVSKAHEAPPSTLQRAMLRAPLRRRSRSVSDLRAVNEQPMSSLTNFKQNFKLPSTKSAASSSKPAAPTKTLTSKATKPGVGTKRPFGHQAEDGATKPKVVKKIPDWDYKARFNQLNEKYQITQNAMKTLKQDIAEIEELRGKATELSVQVETLTIKNQELTRLAEANTVTIHHSNEKIKNLITINKQLESDLKDTLQQKNQFETENNKLRKQSQEFSGQIHKLNEKLTESLDQTKSLEELVSSLKHELMWFESERRIWHNVIQDLKGNIRVFCRVRPRLAQETDKIECPILFPDENGVVLRKKNENFNQITGKSQDGRTEFYFDKVFGPSSSQENIFEDLEQLVQSALDGYNVCVFAYGQTGSGKTYTMQGGEGEHQGVTPRTIHLIFERAAKLQRSGWEYSVQVSFVEIYNENVRDLLNLSGNLRLEICFNEGRGTTVNNLTKQTVKTASELEFYMKKAHQCRATAATDFNEHSSRSHAITKIFLKGVNQEQNLTYEGSINLVDLAGSESAKNAIAGERLNETKNINKSLAVLGDVICALFNKSRHIPYRNSKLTFLLQSSLSGNSKTLMIVNIAPFEECFGESLSALRFAAKVKEIKTHSKRNKALCDVPSTPK